MMGNAAATVERVARNPEQIAAAVARSAPNGPRVLVATGTSCREQLASGLQRDVFYPTELLEALLPQLDG